MCFRMPNIKHIFILSLLFLSLKTEAQHQYLDSLQQVIETTKDDSIRIECYALWQLEVRSTDVSLALEILEDIQKICLRNFERGNLKKTEYYQNELLKAVYNTARIYNRQGYYKEAIETSSKAIKIGERVKNKKTLSLIHNGLANSHLELSEVDRALHHYKIAHKLAIESRDYEFEITVIGNIGTAYQTKGDSSLSANNTDLAEHYYQISAEYYETTVRLAQERDSPLDFVYASAMTAEGLINQGNYAEALELATRALEVAEEEEYTMGQAGVHGVLSDIYREMGNFSQSVEHGQKGLKISRQFPTAILEKFNLENLYMGYEAMGQKDSALRYFEEFLILKDSILSTENQGASIQENFKIEYEKKTASDSVHFADQKAINDAQLAEQSALLKTSLIRKYSLWGILTLILITCLYFYRSFHLKKRDFELIKSQKTQVTNQRKRILDSINYAERIQTSILPDTTEIQKYLPGFSSFFAPKDIVSGDFYWFAHLNGCSYLALSDCTGHGVAGGFMSMIGSTLLKDIVLRQEIKNPAEILEILDRSVRDLLGQHNDKNSDDGMEIAVVKIDYNCNLLEFSGANQKLYLAKNQVEIVESSLRSIGGFIRHPERLKKFETTSFILSDLDAFYLVTDGFEDQFGGPANEKYGRNRVVELFNKIQNHRDLSLLRKEFFQWRANSAQIDDVSVIAVRLKEGLFNA